MTTKSVYEKDKENRLKSSVKRAKTFVSVLIFQTFFNHLQENLTFNESNIS